MSAWQIIPSRQQTKASVVDFTKTFSLRAGANTSSRPPLHAWFIQAAADRGLFAPHVNMQIR